MDVDGNRVLVGAHHALDIVLFEGAGKLAVRVRAVLEAMFLALSGHGFAGVVTNIQMNKNPIHFRDDSYVQNPRARPGKCVAAVDDVSVLREASKHVPHALLQRV